MTTGRLEAFSDGVIAIIITIMVLELDVPEGTDWEAIRSVIPQLLTYVLSFVFLGIYWNNHHHLLQATERVSGSILWANLHLLFWLSLVPFVTRWISQNRLESLPVAIYGGIFLAAGTAWLILQTAILAHHGPDSKLRVALGRDLKGKASAVLYASAIPLAFLNPWVSIALYVVVAVMWLIPDRRIETMMRS